MSADRLNKWLTVMANLAVLMGIGLVILELQQNRGIVSQEFRAEIDSLIAALTCSSD